MRQPYPQSRLPENHNPTDGDLVAAIQRQPLISLRALCSEVWPALPWRPAGEGEISATSTGYAWALRGNRTLTTTPARYLLDRVEDLVLRGLVRRGPFRQDLAGPGAREGGLTFCLPVNLIARSAAGREAVAHA